MEKQRQPIPMDYTILLITSQAGLLENHRLWMLQQLKQCSLYAQAKNVRIKIKVFGFIEDASRQMGVDSSVWNMRLPEKCDLEILPGKRIWRQAQGMINEHVKKVDEVWCMALYGQTSRLSKGRPALVYFQHREGGVHPNQVKLIPPWVDVSGASEKPKKGTYYGIF